MDAVLSQSGEKQTMKTKSAKRANQTPVKMRDIKPRKDAVGGISGRVTSIDVDAREHLKTYY
jgi:hypothetical protein